MGRSIKKSVKYQGVSLPVPLIDDIREFVKNHSEYRSISEFVREAVRFQLLSDKADVIINENGKWKVFDNNDSKNLKDSAINENIISMKLLDQENFINQLKKSIINIEKKLDDISKYVKKDKVLQNIEKK